MENIIRVLITIFVIGMVVMIIVFFSIFGIVPAEKLTKALKGEKATSTDSQPQVIHSTTTIIERIIERERMEDKNEKDDEPSGFQPSYDYVLTIESGEFSPTTLNANKGEEVKIQLKSADEEYTVRIPDYGLSQTVSPGTDKLIAFQALSPGEFLIVCEGCIEGFEAKLIIK